ncbi:MAG: hypothetical protein KF726_09515 [Anaerolineae bacterium]|nr:hypothetical protein [Anaerolineae bacterium]
MKELIRKLTIFTLILIAGAVTSILVARIVGAAQPHDPASYIVLLMDDIEQAGDVWCWRDICPDATAMATANTIGNSFDYFDANLYTINWLEAHDWKIAAEAVKVAPQIVTRIKFILPEGQRFSLGEAMLLYGNPQHVFYFKDRVAGLYWMSVCFDGGVCVEVSNEMMQLTPRLEVFAIFYRGEKVMAERIKPDGEELAKHWDGFRSRLI